MKKISVVETPKVTFDDLQGGTVFMHKGDAFICFNQALHGDKYDYDDDAPYYNAIRTEDGEPYYFEWDTIVQPIDYDGTWHYI